MQNIVGSRGENKTQSIISGDCPFMPLPSIKNYISFSIPCPVGTFPITVRYPVMLREAAGERGVPILFLLLVLLFSCVLLRKI